ncbi:Nonribosomal peptide synthetase fmqA [Fusarium oxysporum f. sp. conglutinans]|nr:Nonribosomal peptide synthetase fmqA [Fusarium oxysporum f. sp. conglutinans]
MAKEQPTLPNLDSYVFSGAPASERLLMAVAQTLDISRHDVLLCDSFKDLGGDEKAAETLRLVCKRKGIEAKTEDIMGCRTLAELQTRITSFPSYVPLSASNDGARSFVTSIEESRPPSLTSHTREDNASSLNQTGRISSVSSNRSLSIQSRSSGTCTCTRPAGQDLENLLMSTPRVSNVHLLTPRAGPFEGQLVALINFSTTSPLETKEILLPSRSEYGILKREIASLRHAVKEWATDSWQPLVWIPLQWIPKHDGEAPDTRRLQTWVQNINEAIYGEVMKFQIPEPRGTSFDPPPPKKQPKPSSDIPNILWQNDDENTINCDDMEYFPLAPMQQLYFQTSMNCIAKPNIIGESGYQYSQSIMLRVKREVDECDIEFAVEAMVASHAMLRARFKSIYDNWVQLILPQDPKSYLFRYHTDVDDEEMAAVIKETQAIIDPVHGPVFAAVHVKNDNKQMLYLVAHQLVVDMISWRIMVHDLDELLQEGTLFSESSILFPHWVEYQKYEMEQRLFEPTLPFEILPADLKYWVPTGNPNLYSNFQQASFSLTAGQSIELRKLCKEVLRADTVDAFLASLLLSFCQVFPDRRPPTLWKQEHGRDTVQADFNLMETVGWFTTLCPVSLELNALSDLIEAMKLAKDTRHAISYDTTHFLTSEFSDFECTSAAIPVEVILNCVDNFQQIQRQDGILELAPIPGENLGLIRSDIGPKVGRLSLFEVLVTTDDSGIRVEFAYNNNCNHQGNIQIWMQRFEDLILETIDRLRSRESELTLSDVPLLKTSYKALQRLSRPQPHSFGLPNVKDIETIYPVTPAQQEILMGQSQSIDSFHIHAIYELHAPNGEAVEANRLCKAWESIIASNRALRSIFIDSVSRGSVFDQVVLKKASPIMLFIDSSRGEEALSQLPIAQTPLTEPCHRLSVCHTPAKALVRIDASQASCDLASIHNLVVELSKVYSGETPSHNDALQNTYLCHIASLDTTYSLEVWRTYLEDVEPCLFPQLTCQTEDTSPLRPFDLQITREQIVTFCHELAVEPAVVLQLGWAIVLRVFVGMDRVSFGYEYSGRDEELLCGISEAIGSFANILPCSIDVPQGRDIKECLKAMNESFVNLQKHQNLSMAEIQHVIDDRGKELYNTNLSFNNSGPFSGEESNEADSGLLLPSLVTSAHRTDCEVSLTVMFVDSHLHASLSSRLLSRDQIDSIMHSFERAINGIIKLKAHSVSDIDLLTDRDHAQLAVQNWNKDQVSTCVHEVILHHSLGRPQAPAIHSWDGKMTYLQLATLVMKLGTYLANHGLGSGMTIPIVLEKSCWAPVMILGVMQAGASFALLDYQDRKTITSTISYLKPPFILATESVGKKLDMIVSDVVIINNAFFTMLRTQPTRPGRRTNPEHAACVFISPRHLATAASRNIFFTHSSLCSAFARQGTALKLDSESRVLQLSAFTVDISLLEILGTMFHGGCVCIPSPKERTNDLVRAISSMKVTWTYMTGVLARRINPESVPTLRTLCFRTRNLDPDIYIPWLEGRTILLAYGAPNICPLGISVTEVAKGKDLSIIPPPLTGRFLVLNPNDSRKLMPKGAIGELAIDSPIVTPHKFAPDLPLIAQARRHGVLEEQTLKYRNTGHRVRYLGNGEVKFVSSVQDEVLIDGFVVDIPEVEGQIRRCLGKAADVVVDKITTRDSLSVLAAFIELGEPLFQGPNGLKNVNLSAKERIFIFKKLFEASIRNSEAHATILPEHCIPTVFIPVQAFPLSTSLKVSRKKLQRMAAELTYIELLGMADVPNPQEIKHVILAQKPLPLTGPEEEMRAIWSHVLSISPSGIGSTSSFFSAGGNKFLAADLIIACREAGIKVSLTDILKEFTLTEICRASTFPSNLSEKQSHRNEISMTAPDYKLVRKTISPKIQHPVQDVLDITAASSMQIRNLELSMYKRRADIVCLVLKFHGPISLEKLESACNALTKVHEMLRTAFMIEGHQVYQILRGSFKPSFQKFSCPMWRLESITQKLVKQEQEAEFKLEEPVTTFTYIDAEDQGALVIRLSKVQVDDTSVPMLLQDLASLYVEAHDLSARPSYFEFMRAVKSASHDEGIEYWKMQLEGAKMTEIVSHHKPYGPTSQVKSVRRTAEMPSLDSYGINHDTIVKVAWAAVLAKVSRSNDVLFGEVIQDQDTSFINDTGPTLVVGPLTNTIPVRLCFPSQNARPLELMQYIQHQHQKSWRYRFFGIQELVQECTKWPSWTQFSTVVHHQIKSRHDPPATLDVGGTVCTYKVIQSEVQDLPDLLLCWTLDSSERVTLDIKFTEDCISMNFVDDCMRLLITAMQTFTCRDTITQPIIQPLKGTEGSEKRMLLPIHPTRPHRMPLNQLLLPEQHSNIKTAIIRVWNQVIKPSIERISEESLHRTPFYNINKSLLPAHFLAGQLNCELRKLRIKGIHLVTVSAEDVLENPTVLALVKFIVSRLRVGAALSVPHLHEQMSPWSEPPNLAATDAWQPLPDTISARLLTRKDTIRQRGSSARARGMSIRSSTWKYHPGPPNASPKISVSHIKL